MGGAEYAAGKIKNRIKVNDPLGCDNAYGAKAIEEESNDDGDKKLKKILDPEVDDPEAPVIDDGVVGRAAIKERRQVENRDRQTGEKKKNRKLAAFGIFEGGLNRTEQQHDPEHKA